MKRLWVLCIMLLGMSSTKSFERSVRNVPDHSSEPATQNLPSSTNDQAVPFDQDAATLAATGSIYQTASITQITSQTPSGPWSISGPVNVTGYVLIAARQVDGDFHAPFFASTEFKVVSNARALPANNICLMTSILQSSQ